MHIRHLYLFLAVPLLFCVCQKKAEQKNAAAKVGMITIDNDNFEAFRKASRIFPTQVSEFFPGSRALATFMVETQVLYSKAKWNAGNIKLRNSRDWEWKKRYFPAQLYSMEVLMENMGCTEKEMDRYYKANLDSFKITIKKDSLHKSDSSYYRTRNEVKSMIVERLFRKKYHPDSVFMASFGDSIPDSTTVMQRWLYFIRNNLPDFFMKQYYKDTYGKKYPDSLSEIYGEGKLISPKDMDVIMEWLPVDRREAYKNPRGTKELVEWLLKWKLFSEKAREEGFSSTKQFKQVMQWAWKMQLASNYVKNKLEPQAREMASIDTSAVLYSYWDDLGNVDAMPDTAALRKHKEDLLKEQTGVIIDGFIYALRKSAGIKFLQADWKDEKVQDPKVLMVRADSLRDTGSTDQAESLYRTLSTDFPFTEQGRKACVELAKIQTEKQMYQQAIKNYRHFLLSGTDAEHKCNMYFMIGFIYDEYMDKSDMAEVQYKWLLKNTPDCELADDAEFMMLHLGEPMTSVEELQAEAKRQGRKIEPSEEDTLDMKADSSSASTTSATDKARI